MSREGIGRAQRRKRVRHVIDVISGSPAKITQPCFYEPERGFQAEFLASLSLLRGRKAGMADPEIRAEPRKLVPPG